MFCLGQRGDGTAGVAGAMAMWVRVAGSRQGWGGWRVGVYGGWPRHPWIPAFAGRTVGGGGEVGRE